MLDLAIFKFDNSFHINPFRWFNKFKFKKSNVRLLFIDNENMPVVDILRKQGWSVEKTNDIRNIDDDIIVRSQIIFVDFRGVGRNFSQKGQGIALIKAIKSKYGGRKRVILYSADSSIPSTLVLTGEADCADAKIRKNANPVEFLDLINDQMKELK